MATANIEMTSVIDKIKKASSVTLKRKLIRYGFNESVVDSLDREELINKALALSGIRQSKLPAPTDVKHFSEEEDEADDNEEIEKETSGELGDTKFLHPSRVQPTSPAVSQMSSEVVALITLMQQQQQ